MAYNKTDVNLRADYQSVVTIYVCIESPGNKKVYSYHNNQQLQTDAVIEGSPVATAIIKLLDKPNYNENGWSGTATDLLTELESYVLDFKIDTKSKSWVKSASSLSHRLNQIKTNMRDLDIEITYTKDVKTRVKIWKINRSVKDRSDRSDRSEGENRAQNGPESANDVSNDHSDANKRSFGDNGQNRAQNQGCERSNDMNDVIRLSLGDRAESDIYRIGTTDSFACPDCKLKGDKWFMQKHGCKGNNKKNRVEEAKSANEPSKSLFEYDIAKSNEDGHSNL
jgi:hypothetical protein